MGDQYQILNQIVLLLILENILKRVKMHLTFKDLKQLTSQLHRCRCEAVIKIKASLQAHEDSASSPK
jgi:hypothetical protein